MMANFFDLIDEFISIVSKPMLKNKTLEIQREIIELNMQLASQERTKALEFLNSAIKNPSLTHDQVNQILFLFSSLMSSATNPMPKLSCNDEVDYKQLYLNDRF